MTDEDEPEVVCIVEEVRELLVELTEEDVGCEMEDEEAD